MLDINIIIISINNIIPNPDRWAELLSKTYLPADYMARSLPKDDTLPIDDMFPKDDI